MEINKIMMTGGDIYERFPYMFIKIYPFYSVLFNTNKTDSTTFILWGCLEKYK